MDIVVQIRKGGKNPGWGDFSRGIATAVGLQHRLPQSNIQIVHRERTSQERDEVLRAFIGGSNGCRPQVNGIPILEALPERFDVSIRVGLINPRSRQNFVHPFSRENYRRTLAPYLARTRRLHVALTEYSRCLRFVGPGDGNSDVIEHGEGILEIALQAGLREAEFGIYLDPFPSLSSTQTPADRTTSLQGYFQYTDPSGRLSALGLGSRRYGLLYAADWPDGQRPQMYFRAFQHARSCSPALDKDPLLFVTTIEDDEQFRHAVQVLPHLVPDAILFDPHLSRSAPGPSQIVILRSKFIPPPLFEGLVKHADLPLCVTGDMSFSEAVRHGRPFFYEALEHKRWLFNEMVRRFEKLGELQSAKALRAFMHTAPTPSVLRDASWLWREPEEAANSYARFSASLQATHDICDHLAEMISMWERATTQ